jgi:hypothetical protein
VTCYFPHELTFPEMSAFLKVLRWIAVFPAAVLATIVVMFPVHWGVQGLRYYEGEENSFMGIPLNTIELLADAFFVPYAFLYVGSHVAPRFKLVTSIVLLVLMTAGISSLLAWAFTSGRFAMDSWFGFGLRVILWIAAGIAGLVHAHQADRELAFEEEFKESA